MNLMNLIFPGRRRAIADSENDRPPGNLEVTHRPYRRNDYQKRFEISDLIVAPVKRSGAA
jgi:hypothetical protein